MPSTAARMRWSPKKCRGFVRAAKTCASELPDSALTVGVAVAVDDLAAVEDGDNGGSAKARLDSPGKSDCGRRSGSPALLHRRITATAHSLATATLKSPAASGRTP